MTSWAKRVLLLLSSSCAAACATQDAEPRTDESFIEEKSDASSPDPVVVPSYAEADIAPTPKMRWSIDGGAVTEGYDVNLTISSPGPHRFQLQGVTPIRGGMPAVVFQFGRGAAFVEAGVYACAKNEAAVVVIQKAGSESEGGVRIGTPLGDGTTARECSITIESAVEQEVTVGVRPASMKLVRGHLEADLGPRNDPNAAPIKVRVAFAATFIESRTF